MIDNTNDTAREELRINLEDCLLAFIQNQKGAAQASADVVSIMRKAIYKTPSLAFYADPKENTLRGMTHPHDTSTPSMSTESVKSEDLVLVPREPDDWMLKCGASAVSVMSRSGALACYRAMIAAAPTLSASHPAKEGGSRVPSIKPIGWDEKPRFGGAKVTGDQGGVHFSAKTVVGRYDIHSFDGDETFVVFMPGGLKRNASTIKAARQIAQWDFEARILSALTLQGDDL